MRQQVFVVCLVCALGIYILFITTSSRDQFKLTKEELNIWTSRSKGLTKGLGITQSQNYVNHTRKVNTRKLKKMLIRNPTIKKRCTKKLPSVLIIGAPKCGTGALSAFLNFNPNIVLNPDKELNFFSKHYDLGTNWYRHQMPCSNSDQLTIEKSTEYLYREGVPERVRNMNQNMKLLLSVCEPLRRTISHFAMSQAHGVIPRGITLGEYLLNSSSLEGLQAASFDLLQLKASMYSRHLSSWLRYFALKQFHIVDGDNLSRDPFEEISAVERFLGLRNYTKKEDFIYNKTKGFFCYKKAVGEPYCLPPGKGRKHPDIGENIALSLKTFYQPFNLEFYNLSRRVFDW